MRLSRTSLRLAWIAGLSAGCLFASAAHGQPATTPQTPPKKEAGPTPAPTPPTTDQQSDQSPNDQSQSENDSGNTSTFDSAVGYIDSAIPQSMLRLRYDAMNWFNFPNRAELFFAKPAPLGPGPAFAPGHVDIQELNTYVEYAVVPDLSIFINTPYRFVHDEIGNRTQGIGDLDFGAKWAFLRADDLVASFQLRTYTPTGDAHEGLGNRHTSIEPAFLLYTRLAESLSLESELRYWAPIGGTDFAGDIIRYGVGVSYGQHSDCSGWLTPVAEFVGWTVLGGKEQVGPLPTEVINASGETIVNGKFGLRFGYGKDIEMYVGYGRALTGTVWYRNDFRTEFRINF
jgi:hypothetical protein